ncbi:hypothetical protein [Arenimonas sp.]|uniref:leucine-rich repeat domain-containing protein n=1 Tax=Arenimonas sp. TaxID=1872635 RepID=UPI002E31161D|nr:hypothetical protein [Arenimonas sp.]HEX4854921.1 hypothetical protein [Arenimonas sp.]
MDIKDILAGLLRPNPAASKPRGEIFEPGDGYWYYRPTLDFPPKSTHDPDDYEGGERLCVNFTHMNLGAAERRKLACRWYDCFPTLDRVRIAWIGGSVSQETFEAVCRLPAVEGLHIRMSAITSLTPIRQLQTLTHFHLGSGPSAQGLEALADLPALVDLEISNVRAAGDLGFFAGMDRLKVLALSGDSNSLKPLKIGTLAPLAGLASLERLSLTTVQLADGSLEPLARLPRLTRLDLSNQFPIEEVARLAGRRPDITCDRFVASTGPVSWMACKTCRRRSMHQLTGKGKAWLCEHCDAARLARHIADFNALKESAA